MKISVVGLAQKRKMVICCASPFISKGEKAWQGTLEYTDTTYPHWEEDECSRLGSKKENGCTSPYIGNGEKAWQGTLGYTNTTFPHWPIFGHYLLCFALH